MEDYVTLFSKFSVTPSLKWFVIVGNTMSFSWWGLGIVGINTGQHCAPTKTAGFRNAIHVVGTLTWCYSKAMLRALSIYTSTLCCMCMCACVCVCVSEVKSGTSWNSRHGTPSWRARYRPVGCATIKTIPRYRSAGRRNRLVGFTGPVVWSQRTAPATAQW